MTGEELVVVYPGQTEENRSRYLNRALHCDTAWAKLLGYAPRTWSGCHDSGDPWVDKQNECGPCLTYNVRCGEAVLPPLYVPPLVTARLHSNALHCRHYATAARFTPELKLNLWAYSTVLPWRPNVCFVFILGPDDRLCWLSFFVVFLSPSKRMSA